MRAFYRELFNWKIDENDLVATIAPGVGPPVEGIGGVIVPAGDAPGTSLFVQVRDLKESLEKAERLGGKKTADPFDVPNGPTIAQIADPEGNLVGLVQM
jgi:predicted enzyme related to lactoylglutathione lyase